jgi:hypothetical protein
MPLNLDRADRRLLIGAGVVFLALVIVGLLFANAGGSEAEIPTTYSSASGGARAAFLLLQESGYNVERWRRSPKDLPDGSGVTLIVAEPLVAPTIEERQQVNAFVRGGGRLIAIGPFGGLFFIEDNGVALDPISGGLWKKVRAASPSPITRAAPEITLAPKAYWKIPPFAVPLYGDPDRPLVVRTRAQAGEVLWWASATPLTNAGLREPGNMEFFLAAIGNREGNRILFDEYFHGYSDSDPPKTSTSRAPLTWLGVQLALLAVVTLLAYSRRSLPVWVPAPESRLSPFEFVETLGNLYERANAAGVAVDICYQRFRFALARRLGLAGNVKAEELAQAVRDRWGQTPEGFDDTLRGCELAGVSSIKPADALRLIRALYGYAAQLKLFRGVAR